MASTHFPIRRLEQPAAAWAPVCGLARGAWHALATGCALAFVIGIGPDVRGEQITSAAYKIDITNSPVWYDSNGNLVSQGNAGSQLSVLERWNLQSQPIVSVTNLSTDTALIGIQLDLSKSASKIISCNWLEAPNKASWNWDDPTASALFQFRDPVAPGDVVSMRLGTAARPNSGNLTYSMNQTFFHPSLGDCLSTHSSFGSFTLFFRPIGVTAIPEFDPSGRPVPDSSTSQTISFADSPITGDAINSLSGGTSVVVPVPEPETIAMAASAIGIVFGWRGLRRRAA